VARGEKRYRIRVKKLFLMLLAAGLVFSSRADVVTNGSSVETIVCLRHAEKPHGGLGQLTPRGLNRALALPKLLLGKFGRPQFLFACNPAQMVDETPPHVVEKGDENKYYYLRPLATTEPMAIEWGLPVNIKFGLSEIKGLEKELAKPKYENATSFVIWEHILAENFAKNVVKHHGGDPAQVPHWTNDDYDMIYVIRITTVNGKKDFSFSVEHEGLTGLKDVLPGQ